MGTTYRYRSGGAIAPVDVARVPLLLACCALGTVGDTSTFDPGASPEDTLGAGHATALAQLVGEAGARCVVSPVEPTYVALPSVTRSGGTSGPAIALSLTGSAGPFDSAALKVTVRSGATSVDVSYDGTSVAESFPIPPELPAVLRGTVDLTPGADLEGLTLVLTSPVSVTKTFPAGSLAASAAGLKAATATSASPVTLTASDLLAGGKTAIGAKPRRLIFITAGTTASDAPASVVITGHRLGVAVTETLSLAQTASSVTSVYAYDSITSLAYAAGDGTGATIAIGYSSAYADAAEVIYALNTLLDAATAAEVTARLYETTDGERYLELASDAAGTGITLTIDAATTSRPEFGFTGPTPLTATGGAATRSLDWLGCTLTFPATSAYVAGESYAWPVEGPRGSVAAYLDALNAAIDDYAVRPFGFVAVGEAPADMATARSLYDALRARAAAKRVDPDDPQLFDVMTPCALHIASATRATNDANIATADAALLTAMSGAAKSLESIVYGDAYIADLPQMPGSHRRPAIWDAVAHRVGLDRIAGNPADGVASCSLRAADGVTWARDESRATTKFGSLSGPGFWALKSTSDGGAKWCPSASRAGALDRYRNPGTVAIALAMSRAIQAQLQAWEGTWDTDPENPIAADPGQLDHRAGELTELINPVAFPGTDDSPKPRNVAKFVVSLSAPTIANDGDVTCALSFNPLAVAESIGVDVTATTAKFSTTGA